MREVLVIGGNRYFGKRLIERLLKAGDLVTVLNRGSAAPPAGAAHLVADRNDEAALRAALGDRSFDVVVDQVCYTPVQAAIARRVFAGRTGRYVMTSTIEVYAHLDADRPLPESALDPRSVRVAPDLPWSDGEFLDAHYADGKQQAEAVFAAAPDFPYVAVRTAHVLGGADDFTGRIDHYARRIRAGEPVAVPAVNHPSTYVYVEEIADFLFWAAGQEFTGPVNAAAPDLLATADICAAVQEVAGGSVTLRAAADGEPVSPFSFARGYGMSVARATELGFRFTPAAGWLRPAVAETLAEHGPR